MLDFFRDRPKGWWKQVWTLDTSYPWEWREWARRRVKCERKGTTFVYSSIRRKNVQVECVCDLRRNHKGPCFSEDYMQSLTPSYILEI